MFDGILIIDKPGGLTSHDVVARLRRILKTKRIGHTGTLDPFATGVLVMLVGQATRLARFLDKDIKEYEATVRFGFETDTGDLTGSRIRDCGLRIEQVMEILEKTDWNDIFTDFRGQIEQTPPMYSAKKVKGKKLYELARQGIEIERDPVKIRIDELELLDEKIPNPKSEARIRVVCSAGTYIRVLAEDIGRKTDLGAHLTALRRTRAGRFDLRRAVTIEELEKAIETDDAARMIVSMNEAVGHLVERRLSADDLRKIGHGQSIDANFGEKDVQQVRLTDEEGSLAAIGIYDAAEKKIRPRMVFSN
ncbi:MAG: tRNA pseudouridine(55) synthase TruB [Pyrinomonadaceae bacterium]